MQVLENDPEGPDDLRQKGLRLAGRILEFDPDVRGGHGFAIARDILDSGRALEKMNRIIEAQGKHENKIKPGSLTFDALAEADGVVTAIDNLIMARIARMAGAPMDSGAGVDLYKKLGDTVKKGDPLYRIYAEFNADFRFACDLSNRNNGYTIGSEDQLPGHFVD